MGFILITSRNTVKRPEKEGEGKEGEKEGEGEEEVYACFMGTHV